MIIFFSYIEFLGISLGNLPGLVMLLTFSFLVLSHGNSGACLTNNLGVRMLKLLIQKEGSLSGTRLLSRKWKQSSLLLASVLARYLPTISSFRLLLLTMDHGFLSDNCQISKISKLRWYLVFTSITCMSEIFQNWVHLWKPFFIIYK